MPEYEKKPEDNPDSKDENRVEEKSADDEKSSDEQKSANEDKYDDNEQYADDTLNEIFSQSAPQKSEGISPQEEVAEGTTSAKSEGTTSAKSEGTTSAKSEDATSFMPNGANSVTMDKPTDESGNEPDADSGQESAQEDDERRRLRLEDFEETLDEVPFPFTAVVGQHKLKKALIFPVINPHLDSLLISGERGTAKSTISMALAELLPEIEEIAGCECHCNPTENDTHCPNCVARLKDEKKEGPTIALRQMPFEIVPLTVTKKELIGYIEEKEDSDDEPTLHVGLVGKANRGFLFIERVNLFDDETILAIFKIANKGVHTIKHGKNKYSFPTSFSIIASMNDEEGELSEELKNKFALHVKVTGIADIEERIEITKRCVEFSKNSEEFLLRFTLEQQELKNKISRSRTLLSRAVSSKKVTDTIQKLCDDFKVRGSDIESLLDQTSITNAVFNERNIAVLDDIVDTADIVLSHRVKL